MNKKIVLTTTLLCTMYSLPALAESPLPSFDKSAVVEYPYNRTGQQDAIIEKKIMKIIIMVIQEPKKIQHFL